MSWYILESSVDCQHYIQIYISHLQNIQFFQHLLVFPEKNENFLLSKSIKLISRKK